MMKKKKGEATIYDVAREAGVSFKTVSRIINQSNKVRESTKLKVLDVIRRLEYAPDPSARGLAGKKSFLIGLVYFENPNTLYVAEIQKGILAAFADVGYELIMHPVDADSDNLDAQVRSLVRRARLDGVILVSPLSQDEAVVDALKSMSTPYIRMSAKLVDEADNVVLSKDFDGAILMTQYLLSKGHSHIGFILGPSNNFSAQKKKEGIIATLEKHGGDKNNFSFVEGDYTFESGFKAGMEIFQNKEKEAPTAIFASNDQMALGIYKAARLLDIAIPEDLSVAGYDDSSFAVTTWPDLTTINQSLKEQGVIAAEKLMMQLNKDFSPVFSESDVQPTLVIRESTSCL